MTTAEKPRLIIVAGPNGSGKTTITEKLLMHEWMDGCVYINPDLIARDDFGDWNSRDAGYFIRLFFICTNDPSINAQRVAQRVMQNGHDVPISKIISRYYKSIENCVESVTLVDRLYFYDNSQTDKDPELLFRVNDAKLTKVYAENMPVWAESILATFT